VSESTGWVHVGTAYRPLPSNDLLAPLLRGTSSVME